MKKDTVLLLKYRSFRVRLCRHRTTCIAFFLFQAPTPRPGFSSQASDQGWTWWQGERLLEGVGEVSFFTERCVNLCSPWGHPCSKLPDPWRIKRLYTYAPITCPADLPSLLHEWKLETEIWLGVRCPSPLQVHRHPLYLVTKYSCQSGPHHSKCMFTHDNDYNTQV